MTEPEQVNLIKERFSESLPLMKHPRQIMKKKPNSKYIPNMYSLIFLK